MAELVCAVTDIAANQSRAFDVNGLSILICHSGGQFYALENRCSHQETPLAGGRIRRGYIACPLHGVMFELASGKPTGTLTKNCVATYPVEVIDGQISVTLPPA